MTQTAEKILGKITITKDTVNDIKKSVKNISDFGKKVELHSNENITEFLNTILIGAIILEASDIHIEPEEKKVRLRIRIDGILRDIIFFEQDVYHNLLSRLKLLSNLKLNITEKPQDGRFTIAMEDSLIEIRTSSLPSERGETIVMRILNPKNLMELSSLGLRGDLHKTIEKELEKPNGMIAVAGPTGSGKTTTLYAFLMKIQNPGIKIITIEDPIEYHLTGVSQTQVEPEKGYSFSEGLASIVRQDPDVILIGEIRDSQTAKISLQAALTGHLVLTTIHTNDAAGAIPRLIDLGAGASSIAPALKMVVGQRLIRKVCKECSVATKPSSKELAEIKKGLKGVPKNIGVPKDLNKVKIAKASEKGCKHCNLTGYKERKGIFETFLVDSNMEKFILTNPPVSEIKKMAVKNGMVTIYQSGLIEVVLGQTTLEEVKRVVGSEE